MSRYDMWAYAVGVVTASVCTSLDDQATISRMNIAHPVPNDHGWAVSGDPTFSTGEPNPYPCPRHPDTHRHILYEC